MSAEESRSEARAIHYAEKWDPVPPRIDAIRWDVDLAQSLIDDRETNTRKAPAKLRVPQGRLDQHCRLLGRATDNGSRCHAWWSQRAHATFYDDVVTGPETETTAGPRRDHFCACARDQSHQHHQGPPRLTSLYSDRRPQYVGGRRNPDQRG